MSAPILRPMQVRIPDSLRNWLKAQARAEDRSVNWYLNRLLEKAQKGVTHG
jgi:predicted HicB family RNase H-like nuclease